MLGAGSKTSCRAKSATLGGAPPTIGCSSTRCCGSCGTGAYLAGFAGAVWRVEFGIPAIQSLVQTWRVEIGVGSLAGSRSGMSAARFNHRASPPACRRGETKKGGADEALGRSRGGFSSKLHVAVDAQGRPVELRLTPGQEHDLCQAECLLAEHEPKYVIADKGYDSDKFLDHVASRGSTAVIPSAQRRHGAAAVAAKTIPSTERRRTLCERREALSSDRDALREDGPQLPQLHPTRRLAGLAKMNVNTTYRIAMVSKQSLVALANSALVNSTMPPKTPMTTPAIRS